VVVLGVNLLAERLAREAAKVAGAGDGARVVLGRIQLERYRRSAAATDLDEARAALRSVDPALREAAVLDGAGEWTAFRRVTFPVLQPMNVVIVVITLIEALRAFDIVYVINRGLNGLELLSVLVTNTIVGEGSRVGYGSAIATVLLLLSVIPIALFVWRWSREDAA
jgi:ABC-type Fe3+ transport system permease subunit